MYLNVNETLAEFDPGYKEELFDSIRDEFIKSDKTIVVLDDDPTGTQTCHHVTVLTSWNVVLIAEELQKNPSILFILTNSRSLPQQEAVELTSIVCKNLKEAVRISGRQIIVISRSDSTLRGHFPAEVDAIAMEMDMKDAVIVLVPAFIEGGRLTIDDVHYLAENEAPAPVSETAFAKDAVFGYSNANLKSWVEEKTNGRVKASEVSSISLKDIRIGGPGLVADKLNACANGTICIVNAASYRDLEVVVRGLMLAENSGRKFLYRTSATIVPIRAGMQPGKVFVPHKVAIDSINGSLVVVGSHVPKTTSQLNWLLENGNCRPLEIKVSELLKDDNAIENASVLSEQVDQLISTGNNVVIYTSRKLETGHDVESNLKINSIVSGFLVSIMKGLTARPKFFPAQWDPKLGIHVT